MTTKTAIDEEGIFFLRPLFYPTDSAYMKFDLSSANFKPKYQSFKNPFHPFVAQPCSNSSSQQAADKHSHLNSLQSIFDHAMILDRTTKTVLKENRKIIPGFIIEFISTLIFDSVASARVGSSHSDHAMVLECIYADVVLDASGSPILDSNGERQFQNYSFKFKNTDKNNKEVEIRAGTLIG